MASGSTGRKLLTATSTKGRTVNPELVRLSTLRRVDETRFTVDFLASGKCFTFSEELTDGKALHFA